ncbi:hypothetical protein M3Y99_00402400 [Aphelenchoides fujianensis]|nr:hypothetical protein M3Y99_00402400 [Aphelenchoides fujianensis]
MTPNPPDEPRVDDASADSKPTGLKAKKRQRQTSTSRAADRMQEYEDVKLLYMKGRYKKHLKEIVVTRRLTVEYSGLSKLEEAVERDLLRVPLDFRLQYFLAKDQLIYGIQPYQHIEYKVRCIAFTKLNCTNAPFKVTAITRKASGVLFGRIPAIVANTPPDYKIGQTYDVSVKKRISTKFGAVTFNCEPKK